MTRREAARIRWRNRIALVFYRIEWWAERWGDRFCTCTICGANRYSAPGCLGDASPPPRLYQ